MNDLKNIFCKNSTLSTQSLIKYISDNDILPYKCKICGISEWNDKFIILELDHINGDNRDNRIENLRFLCPNCHSQTDTWRGRGKSRYPSQYMPDNTLVESLENNKNIRQSLISLGLVPKGGNYLRCKKLIKDKNVIVGKNYIEPPKKEKKNVNKKKRKGILEENKQKYYSNPKYCKKCGELIPYEKKNNTYCNVTCLTTDQRRCKNRPDVKTLKHLVSSIGYCATGRIYGVSDNAIRKWMKNKS